MKNKLSSSMALSLFFLTACTQYTQQAQKISLPTELMALHPDSYSVKCHFQTYYHHLKQFFLIFRERYNFSIRVIEGESVRDDIHELIIPLL